MSKKPIPKLATLLTLIGVLILCSLGTWQLKRLQWKTELITNLNQAYKDTQAPEPLTPESLQSKQFAYGTLTGKLLLEKTILLGPRTYESKIGNHAIVPLVANNTTYLINMGWTEQPISMLRATYSRPVTITGLARKPSWNSFTPNNKPDQDLWYKADITEISTAKNLKNPAPFILYAHKTNTKIETFYVLHKPWYPKNNHTQYGAFWFGMAIVLLTIYWIRFFRRAN